MQPNKDLDEFDFSTIDLSFANLHSIKVVVDYLDQVMVKTPSRALADVANFMQDLAAAVEEAQ